MKSARGRPHYTVDQRRRWMETLAGSSLEQLTALFRSLQPRPDYERVDCTSVSIEANRARPNCQSAAGPDGRMIRCVVRLQSGSTGTACLPGTNAKHAEMAAVFDALLKEPQVYDTLACRVAETTDLDLPPAAIVLSDRAR